MSTGIRGSPASGMIGSMAATTPSSGPDPRTPARYPWHPPGARAAHLVLDGEPLPLAGTARIYTCGITPYDVTHLGHAATFVWSDLVASVAHALGVAVETCRNVTDFDDVLTAAASGSGWAYDEFALTHEFLFDRDMKSLK